MLSFKLFFLIICVIGSLTLLCDSFKLHLNRETKDYKDIGQTEKSKLKFKYAKHIDDRKLDLAGQDSEEDFEKSNKIEKVVDIKHFPKPEVTLDHHEDTKLPPVPKAPEHKGKRDQEGSEIKSKTEKYGKKENFQDGVDEITKPMKTQKKDPQQKVKVQDDDKEKEYIKKNIAIHDKIDSKAYDIKDDSIILKEKVKVKNETLVKVEQKKSTQPKADDKKSSKSEPELPKTTKEKSDSIEKQTKEAKSIKNIDLPKTKSSPDKLKDDSQIKDHDTLEVGSSSKEDNIAPSSDTNGNLEQEQFNILYRSLPSFAPNYNIVKNEKCRREGQIFLRQLKGHKLWALQMLDASAKLPSGILRGNLNQLGDYDACLEAFARVKVHKDKPAVPVRGKYCLAEIDFAAVAEGARYPVHLLQARNFIRSNRKDTGHFIPKFTTINWAICVPSACTYQDAEDLLIDAITPYNMTTGLKISLDVREEMCYTKKHIEWWRHSSETLATLGFYIVVLTIASFATLKDCWQSWTDVANTELQSGKDEAPAVEQKDGFFRKIFMSFSIKRSGEELLKNESSDGDIQCIHGIRAVTTLILYCAHKLLPIARTPFSNRTYLTEIANSQWSVFLRISLIYTDTFLLLSGVLSAYNMSKDMMNKGEISWFKRLITRYIRLTPALAAVLLFYAYIWDHIGGGPQWANVVSANAQLCQENMWKNLLYIQNFYPFEEMCATHTHQLALDMQLTVLAPILVWFLYKAPMWGLVILGGLHSISVGLRYFATINHRLSLVIFHGMSLSQLIRTANFSYANALHRATPYLTGIGLGVMLKNTGKNIQLPKVIVALGWLGALYFFGWTFNAPAHLSKRDYQYDVEEAAQFSASSSVAWALALSWLIFACHTDNGGSINNFLCSRPLILLSRISYAIYLVQFIIFFYNVGTFRSSTVFDVLQSFNILEFISVIIASIVITLLFDIPMQEIKNIIMKSSENPKSIEELDLLDKENVISLSESEGETHYQNYDYDAEETTKNPYDYEEEVIIESNYYRQESQDSQDGISSPERGVSFDEEPSVDTEPNSENPHESGHDLYDYEYNDELDEEDATEPTTEREIDGEDQDLKDWEWAENEDKQNDEKQSEN